MDWEEAQQHRYDNYLFHKMITVVKVVDYLAASPIVHL